MDFALKKLIFNASFLVLYASYPCFGEKSLVMGMVSYLFTL